MIIDLAKYRSAGIRVFAGRARGEVVRHALNLDAFDAVDETAEVRIPDDVYSVNSSFFLGLFAVSIRRLGRERFLVKYRVVTGPGSSHIQRALLDAVSDASETGNPLAE